jgi:glycosyltransferase involved in cell wall biosynthesis
MIRILVVSAYYAEHGGGVEVVAGELARRFAARGAEVLWAASASPQGHQEGRLLMRAWNVSERRLDIPYPLWEPLSIARLQAAVRGSDVVHIHDCLYQGSVSAFLCARASGKPVVVTQHVGLIHYRSRLPRLLMAGANRVLGRLVLGGCDRCVFISRTVQAYFAGFARPARPAFIPNGVDTWRFRPVPADERRRLRERLGWPAARPVLLFVGRFTQKKGLPILRCVAERLPGCDWVFIGWGMEDPSGWGLANVRCLGQVAHEHLSAYYQAADLLVLPSVGEGFPLVVQEAMACGTPVLISTETAAAMPGIEAVAFACDPTPGAVETRLAGILEDRAGLEDMRGASAAFARSQWDWDRCADQYWELFAALTGGFVDKVKGTHSRAESDIRSDKCKVRQGFP